MRSADVEAEFIVGTLLYPNVILAALKCVKRVSYSQITAHHFNFVKLVNRFPCTYPMMSKVVKLYHDMISILSIAGCWICPFNRMISKSK